MCMSNKTIKNIRYVFEHNYTIFIYLVDIQLSLLNQFMC